MLGVRFWGLLGILFECEMRFCSVECTWSLRVCKFLKSTQTPTLYKGSIKGLGFRVSES